MTSEEEFLRQLLLGSNHERYLEDFLKKYIDLDYQGMSGRIILGDIHDNSIQIDLHEYKNSKTGQMLYMSERDFLALNPDWARL
jgi:hypothetical protein